MLSCSVGGANRAPAADGDCDVGSREDIRLSGPLNEQDATVWAHLRPRVTNFMEGSSSYSDKRSEAQWCSELAY